MNPDLEASMAEIDMRLEKFTEDSVMKAFPDSLLNDGDMIYVRKIGGRIQWFKANRTGSDEKWTELTPVTTKHLENGGDVAEAIKPASLSPEMIAELTKPETHKIGWYQDAKGDLYQYNGTEWVGTVPTEKQIAELEYLG